LEIFFVRVGVWGFDQLFEGFEEIQGRIFMGI
jgi:hypothetical protein